MKTILVSLLVLPLLAGCAGTGKIVRELAKDPAVGKIKATSVWVNLEVWRIGAQSNNAVAISNDSMTLTPAVARPASATPPVPQP